MTEKSRGKWFFGYDSNPKNWDPDSFGMRFQFILFVFCAIASAYTVREEVVCHAENYYHRGSLYNKDCPDEVPCLASGVCTGTGQEEAERIEREAEEKRAIDKAHGELLEGYNKKVQAYEFALRFSAGMGERGRYSVAPSYHDMKEVYLALPRELRWKLGELPAMQTPTDDGTGGFATGLSTLAKTK